MIEQKFRQILDGMQEACRVIGFDWKYLYINKAAIAQGGFTENPVGRNVLELLPGFEHTEIFAHYRRAMEERVDLQFETSFAAAGGVKRWYQATVHPIEDGIVVFSSDITERR